MLYQHGSHTDQRQLYHPTAQSHVFILQLYMHTAQYQGSEITTEKRTIFCDVMPYSMAQ